MNWYEKYHNSQRMRIKTDCMKRRNIELKH